MCNCRGLHAGFTVVVLFFFFFTSATSVLSSLFSFSGSFSSILLTMFFSQHHIFNAFSPKHVLFTVFGFWNIFKMFCCLACKIKSLFAENRGNFLTEFCCSNSSNLIGSRWFLLFFQPIRDHLKFALVLQENCSPFSANQK